MDRKKRGPLALRWAQIHNLMSIKAVLLSLVLLIVSLLSVECSFATSHKIGQTYNILENEISISAKLIEMEELPDEPPYYSFSIILENSNNSYEVKSDIIAVDNFNEAIEVLKKSILVKDSYIFIRNECGGGNGWRCQIDSVFRINEGVLHWVGDIAGTEERGRVGLNYSNGLFMDYYDKFESNNLTSHADAPSLEIFSRDFNGKLRADLKVTWQNNIILFKKSKVISDRILLGTALSDDEYRELWSALLQEAVIAKYCERSKELNEILQIAEHALKEDIMKEFRAIVSNVYAGELPETRVQKK